MSQHAIDRHKMKHTPGPWKVGKYKTTVVSEHKVEVTPASNLIGHDGGANDTEYYGGSLIAESILRDENAKLIAAAPEMYEVLIGLTLVENEDELDDVIDQAKKLINNIRGE